jgi:hypothetical protein
VIEWIAEAGPPILLGTVVVMVATGQLVTRRALERERDRLRAAEDRVRLLQEHAEVVVDREGRRSAVPLPPPLPVIRTESMPVAWTPGVVRCHDAIAEAKRRARFAPCTAPDLHPVTCQCD